MEYVALHLSHRENFLARQGAKALFTLKVPYHVTEMIFTKIKIERFLEPVQRTTLSPKGKEASQVYHSSRDLQEANLLSPFLVKMPTPKTAPKATKKPTTTRSAIADVVAREYTIHLHKRVRLPT